MEPLIITNREELVSLLGSRGIDIISWGTGSAKTVDHLLAEVLAGETVFDVRDGRLRRQVTFVSVNVFYEKSDWVHLHLREDRQEFADGRVRRRPDVASVSEKLTSGEDPEEALVRALKEELDVEGQVARIIPLEMMSEQVPSPSYPGLISQCTIFPYRVWLTKQQFRPEGYVEHQPDKTTYFRWENYRGRKPTASVH